MKPADCAICDGHLPLGGVLDHVGRPVHYWCRELARLETAELARQTAGRVAKYGRKAPKEPPSLPTGANAA